MQRTATIQRKTNETDIKLSLDIDGQGQSTVSTGVGFLDHMLELFARHAMIDLEVQAVGDLDVDDHHTVEDTGICLGLAIRQAVGDKAGIRRYGHFTLPMDETLVTAALDLSGRSYLLHHVEYPTSKIGHFDTELVREFWQAFANSGQLNLHLMLHHGCNSHHISEASFKATARALRQATEVDPRLDGAVPSTKGTLS
ncbi:MAG: imidazoleglycerol-phosphate dehydratase [Planctomycetaceae bacterium]|nr:imidazoleglycerol-phosphate dehydratase [Planctomycetaceae bacterium]